MASEHAVIIEESLRIPADALTFEGFRNWAHSPEFPDTGRVDYLAGDVEVDMSPEDLHTHGIVKVAITAGLHVLVTARELGEVFADSTRITSPLARLSAEPDVVVVLWESLQAGRVRYLPAAGKGPDRFTEIEGAPDVVVEVVSDSSVRKDTERLPPRYAQAGIPELWIVDTRGRDVRFDLQFLQGGEYVSRGPDAEGWMLSDRLGVLIRLARRKTPLSTWRYLLEHREP
jgi:Uma2 family endonuclease